MKDWGLDGKFQEDALTQWRNGATASGKLQGFPYSGFTWPVWYNMSLLNKAGITEIPATTDDLITDAQKLRAAGIGPFIVGGKDWTGQKLFFQIIQSYASADEIQKVMTTGGYCSTPSVMKGIDLFTKLRDAGVFVDNTQGYSADDMNTTFFAQKAAMMSSMSNFFGAAATSGTDVVSNIKLGGFPLPSGSSFSMPTEYKGFTSSGFMITKRGASPGHIELVKKLIMAFMAKDVVDQFVKEGNNVTPLKGDYSAVATNPLLQSSLGMDSKLDGAVLPDSVARRRSRPGHPGHWSGLRQGQCVRHLQVSGRCDQVTPGEVGATCVAPTSIWNGRDRPCPPSHWLRRRKAVRPNPRRGAESDSRSAPASP